MSSQYLSQELTSNEGFFFCDWICEVIQVASDYLAHLYSQILYIDIYVLRVCDKIIS